MNTIERAEINSAFRRLLRLPSSQHEVVSDPHHRAQMARLRIADHDALVVGQERRAVCVLRIRLAVEVCYTLICEQWHRATLFTSWLLGLSQMPWYHPRDFHAPHLQTEALTAAQCSIAVHVICKADVSGRRAATSSVGAAAIGT
eukprot:scaffold104210_cov75-Phaeocystis_antarctica.AAC.4